MRESSLDPRTARTIKSPFTSASFDATMLPPAIAARLAPSAADRWTASAEGDAGKLLASAIWNGALLDRGWWTAWITSLGRGFRHDGHLRVEMLPFNAEPRGDPGSRPRRWFADPLTHILALRWIERGASLPASTPGEKCLQAYLDPERRLGDDPATLAASLLRAAEMRWRQRMPGVLVETALGHVRTSTSDEATWRRIETGQPVPADRESTRSQRNDIDWSGSMFAEDRSLHRQMRIVLTTRDPEIIGLTSVRRSNAMTLRRLKAIAIDGSSLSDTAKMLHEWSVAMLAEKLQASTDRVYAPETAYGYLLAMRQHVFQPGLDHRPPKLEVDLRARYLTAFERLGGSAARNRLIDAAQAFHRFVDGRRPEWAMDTQWMNAYRTATIGAVNLICEADYQRARAALPLGRCEHVQYLRIWLMLGYRAGLRAREIRALTVEDVLVFRQKGVEHVELVVRNKPDARTKTRESRRILPLHLLLAIDSDRPSECELTEFLLWFKRAGHRAGRTGHGSLFVDPDRPTERLRESVLTKPLEELLRKVTQDERVSFGTLRHSFVSYLMTTLLLPSDGTCLPTPSGLGDAVSLHRCARVASPLCGAERLGQAAVHAVAELAGHAPVETTLFHYMHLLDWCIGAHVCRSMVQVGMTNGDAARLLGAKPETIRKAVQRAKTAPATAGGDAENYRRPVISRAVRMRGRAGEDAPPSVHMDHLLPVVLRSMQRTVEGLATSAGAASPLQRTASDASTSADRLDWRLVRMVLDLDDRPGGLGIADEPARSPAELARELDLPLRLVVSWLRNRRAMMALAMSRSGFDKGGSQSRRPRPRHLTARAEREAADPVLVMERSRFPRRPSRKEEVEADRIWSCAVSSASSQLQAGIDVFRTRYDAVSNSVVASSWSEARRFHTLLAALKLTDRVRIEHRPARGRSRHEVAELLPASSAPRPWSGTVAFRFVRPAGGAAGRGYGLRFALTMIAIAGMDELAALQRGSRLRYMPPPPPTTIALPTFWHDFPDQS